jgi:FkbM family methyltransferase
MIEWGGWYFPDGEEHLQDWMWRVKQKRHGRLSYQLSKYLFAMKSVRGRRVAVDIGGHIGLWSYQMAHDFESVHAFEAMPAHCECYRKNMANFDNVTLHEIAIGAEPGNVQMQTRTANSSGDTGVAVDGVGVTVPMATLDSFELTDVDFIKCDLEGYELFAMQGARETILANWPIIIVEQKPHTGGPKRYGISDTAAVEFLETLGYRCIKVISGDYAMVPASVEP